MAQEMKWGGSPPPVGLEQMLVGSRFILDLLPVATCICDLSGRIIQFNKRAVEIWGRAPDGGDTHQRFSANTKYFSPDGTLLARDEIPMAQALATGEVIHDREMIVERPDGSQVVITIS